MLVFLSLLWILVLVAGSYGLGALVLHFFRLQEAAYFTLFLQTLVGFLLLVTGFALVRTHGHTILLPVPCLLLGAVWLGRAKPGEAPVPAAATPMTGWRVLLLAVPLVCLARLVSLSYAAPGQVLSPVLDYMFYSKIAWLTDKTGIESPWMNTQFGANVLALPYHYLDSWAAAILMSISELPVMLLLSQVVYPMLLLLAMLGFLAIASRYLSSRIAALAVSFLGLFIGGFYVPWLQQFHFVARLPLSNYLLTAFPKTLPVLVLLSLVYYWLITEKYTAASWAVVATIFAYPPVALAIGFGMGCFVCYLLARRYLTVRQSAVALLPFVLGGLYSYWLYRVAQHVDNTYQAEPGLLTYLPHGRQWIHAINSSVGYLVAQPISYAPYVLLILFIWTITARANLTKRLQSPPAVVVATALLLMSGALMGGLFSSYFDGLQLAVNLLSPLAIVSLLVLLAVGMARLGQRGQVMAIGAMIVFTAYNLTVQATPMAAMSVSFGEKFVQQVRTISPQLSQSGAFIMADTEYRNPMDFHDGISPVGAYLPLLRNGSLVSLSVAQFDNAVNTLAMKRDVRMVKELLIRNSPFSQYVRKLRRLGQFTTIEDAQCHYLQRNSINFVCASPQARLPPCLAALVRQQFCDPVSGQCLYLLNIPLTPASQLIVNQQVIP